METKRCFYCGTEVGPNSRAYVGQRQVYMCDSRECGQEAANHEREVYDDARERFVPPIQSATGEN